MKRVMIFLDDETGRKLTDLSKRERRSVKAMTEKIVVDYIEGAVKENEEVRV